MAVFQLAVRQQVAARQWRDQHGVGTLLLGKAGIIQKEPCKLLRCGVARWVIFLFIVVAKLNQQQISRLQGPIYRLPQALGPEALGTAAIFGVVMHRDAGAQVKVQHLPHAALRPCIHMVELYGGISNPVHGGFLLR